MPSRLRTHPVRVAMLAAMVLVGAQTALVSSVGAAVDAKAQTVAGVHEHHRIRSLVNYVAPAVDLIRDDGKSVRLAGELADSRPVVLDFVYTTCTTVCPLLSATFAQLQQKLGAERDSVRLISISIDPEEDTPQRLAEFAKRYSAGPTWHYYTGSIAASLAVQRAFNVYRGDKMSHTPVTLVRAAPGEPWVRFDGFASADDLLGELPGRIATP